MQCVSLFTNSCTFVMSLRHSMYIDIKIENRCNKTSFERVFRLFRRQASCWWSTTACCGSVTVALAARAARGASRCASSSPWCASPRPWPRCTAAATSRRNTCTRPTGTRTRTRTHAPRTHTRVYLGQCCHALAALLLTRTYINCIITM